jgi:hypothetical protein
MEQSSIDLCYQPLFFYHNLYSKAALMNFYIFKELVQPFFDIEGIIIKGQNLQFKKYN